MKINKLISFFAIILIMLSFVIASDSYILEVSDISPSILMPGEETELTFEIENVGDLDIEEIIFSWEEETGNILPIGTSNTKILEELDEGDEETLKFNVFTSASAEPNLYELTLTLSFETENETITQTSKAGVIVGGETDFDLAVSDISGNEVLLSIANIGQNNANSVTISIPTQSGFKVVGTSSSILGNIEKDDYSIVSFQLIKTSTISNLLEVEIFYTDTMGIRQTITKQVKVELNSNSMTSPDISGSSISNTNNKDNSNSNLFLYGLAGVSLIALIAVGLMIKKIGNKEK